MMSYESTTMRMVQQELGACTLIQDLLPLYLEGEVSPSSRDLIVEHLARCERCAGFLAGAQSVRLQLRRESDQRAHVVWHEQPARRAISAAQRRAMLFVTLTLCALGGGGSAMVVAGLKQDMPGPIVMGLLISLACFSGLVGLAHKSGRLTLTRWLSLITSCLVGAAGTTLIVLPREDQPKLIGMVLVIVALAIVWLTIEPGGQQAQTDQ